MVKLTNRKGTVSINDRSQLLDLDRYVLYKLDKNNYDFSMIMNVPTDGWCLLYAVQLVMLIDHEKYVDLLAMRLALLNEFEKRIKDKSSGIQVKEK